MIFYNHTKDQDSVRTHFQSCLPGLDMTERAKRNKKEKFSLDGIKEAREGGKSRLDQYEVCKI